MDVINERSGIEVRAFFADAYDVPTVPSTVHWRLDCETTSKEIQGFVEVTPTTITDASGISEVYVSITVPGSLNAIQDNRNWRELKTVLIVANKDQDGEYSEPYQYYVKNLRGRS